jgi:hypothetical protein
MWRLRTKMVSVSSPDDLEEVVAGCTLVDYCKCRSARYSNSHRRAGNEDFFKVLAVGDEVGM